MACKSPLSACRRDEARFALQASSTLPYRNRNFATALRRALGRQWNDIVVEGISIDFELPHCSTLESSSVASMLVSTLRSRCARTSTLRAFLTTSSAGAREPASASSYYLATLPWRIANDKDHFSVTEGARLREETDPDVGE